MAGILFVVGALLLTLNLTDVIPGLLALLLAVAALAAAVVLFFGPGYRWPWR